MFRRTLKFRVWDVEAKRFSYSDKFLTVIEPANIDFKLGLNLSNERYKNCKEYDDYPVQQYTGLKDKNNREIYEGDIIGIKRNGETQYLAEVIYSEKFHGFRKVDTADFPLTVGDKCSFYEVLGNVFENPELVNSILLKRGQ